MNLQHIIQTVEIGLTTILHYENVALRQHHQITILSFHEEQLRTTSVNIEVSLCLKLQQVRVVGDLL